MNNKGFTTIELILAIAIAGIIMGAVGTFLTFNLRSFNATKAIVDMQYESQIGFNQLVDLLRESEGLLTVKGEDGTNIPLYAIVNKPSEFSFERRIKDGAGGEDIIHYLIEYDQSQSNNHKLVCTITYSDGSPQEVYDLCQYLSDFSLKAAPGKNLTTTRSLAIFATFKNKEAHLDLQTEVKLRNMP